MSNPFATVAAISTPPGKGGVALIRVSGASAFAVADKVFKPKSGNPLSKAPVRMQVYGDILYENEIIDDGMAVRFAAPHSYTGEDTVELTCHGGMVLARTVLEALFRAGAEPAGRGEFTRRAFTNGKLSLTDAEGIGKLLEAQGLSQIRLAATKSRDRLSAALTGVREKLVGVMSSIFARVDYPDEDLGDFTDEETLQKLKEIEKEIDALLSTYKTGRSIADGVPTAIVGKPNVGKSSLYNLLVGEDLAIVTDVAGTTRDVLEHTAVAGDVTLRLFDTAGLHDTEDPVEKIGVEKTSETLARADLILAVFDLSKPLEKEDFSLMEQLKATDKTVIAVANKSDLPAAFDLSALDAFSHVVTLCAKSGERKPLSERIESLFVDGKLKIGEDAIVYSARQYSSLVSAKEALASAVSAYEMGLPADAASSDVEIAVGILSQLEGKRANEEIVADIFKNFCVGK